MGSHLFHAHGVERRQAKEEDKTTSRRRAPTTPPKKESEETPEPTAKSRWAEVRKTW
jgi:hypothetical protein